MIHPGARADAQHHEADVLVGSVCQHLIPGMQADAATVFSDLVAGALHQPATVSASADDDV